MKLTALSLLQLKVYLRPDADIKLFRIPESLPSKTITTVKIKPENRVVQLESRPRKSSDNQVYNSRVMIGQNSLAVGIVRGDDLFLTQVSDSFEFKPNLKRLDSKYRTTSSKGSDVASVEDVPSSSSSKVTSVTMRFAGANEEDLKRARENSYVHHLEKIQSEQAIELEYVQESTDRANDVLESLGRL